MYGDLVQRIEHADEQFTTSVLSVFLPGALHSQAGLAYGVKFDLLSSMPSARSDSQFVT